MILKLPSGWHEVNLGQLIELEQLRQRNDLDAIEVMTQSLSILSGRHIDDVESLPYSYLVGKWNKMNWVLTYPDSKPSRAVIKLKYKRYRITTNPAAISAGEFATLQTIVQDGNFVENLHKVIACLMVEQKKSFIGHEDVRYSKVEAAEQFKIKSELAKSHLSVAAAYPYALFFSTLLPKLLQTSQTFLESESKKIQKAVRKQIRAGL